MKKQQITSPQKFLRDFIYLDIALVNSYLEQLTGGVPHAAQITREYQAGANAGVNVSLFHLNLEGGGARSYAENQTIYWDRYARLEKELRKNCKLVELKSSEQIVTNIEPHTLFLFSGSVLFNPDWSNWSSGISLAKIIIDKLRQLNDLEAKGQVQPDANGMVPMLLGPGGNPVVTLQKDMLSELLPHDLPNKPPSSIQRLMKPVGVNVSLKVGSLGKSITLEGNAALQHFTPHRVDRLVAGPAKEDVFVLGLVTERVRNSAQFSPLAIFVKI